VCVRWIWSDDFVGGGGGEREREKLDTKHT